MNINDYTQHSNFVNVNKNLEEKNKSNLFNNIIDEPISPFLYIPSPEELIKESKPKIPIPVKFINQSYHMKKLQKLNYTKKNIYGNNNIILRNEKNIFPNFSKAIEDKINENDYNIFNNIDKFGPNKPDFFLKYKSKKKKNTAKVNYARKRINRVNLY